MGTVSATSWTTTLFIPTTDREFSRHYSKIGCGVQVVFVQRMGIEVKVSEHETDHLPLTGPEVMNARYFIYSPKYIIKLGAYEHGKMCIIMLDGC
jgi:hypothetical protein